MRSCLVHYVAIQHANSVERWSHPDRPVAYRGRPKASKPVGAPFVARVLKRLARPASRPVHVAPVA